jgi:glycosyltransferase involved in cell wall biosynthesis
VEEKIKVLVLSDHPLSPSGVGIQTKNMIDAMLQTGKYKFVCLGGAIKHADYRPLKTEEWGDDFVVYPIDGYGSPDQIRSLLRAERPNLLWFMTDPRFWGWLWQMEDEIRPLVPMVYYHVWDNFPAPTYNRPWYESTDVIACISKVTKGVVDEVVPEHGDVSYLPHSVDTDIFCKLPAENVTAQRLGNFPDSENKTIFLFNSRNARRKQSGSLIFWFNAFLNKVGRDEALLVMHTDPKDPHGQDLEAIIELLDLKEKVMLSRDKLPPESMAVLYGMADCTVSISDAEGFGLSTLESLATETPIIVTMTGGLKEQVTDGENWFGVGIEPASRAIIGSQDIPWIYEDRVSEESVVAAMEKIHNMGSEEREMLGHMGRQHVLKNYNFQKYAESWDKLLTHVVKKFGSWDTRKNYKSWNISEVK